MKLENAIRGISHALRIMRDRRIASLKLRRASDGAPRHTLSIATVMKDEGVYLAEWLAFHRLMGVEHFLLYDNGSTDGTLDVLRPFIESGHVTLIPWPHFAPEINTQMLAYAHAIAALAPLSRWVAFVDVDEFLFSPKENDLKQALSGFGELPSILAFRHSFGTSGHLAPPSGLVIENFTKRMPVPAGKFRMNGFLAPKPIVQPARLSRTLGAHYLLTDQPGILGYDERRRAIRKGQAVEFSADLICINHYYTKDKATFEQRMSRATDAGGKTARPRVFADRFAELEERPVSDRRIMRFVEQTRNAMTGV